jgi:hypothetical protein
MPADLSIGAWANPALAARQKGDILLFHETEQGQLNVPQKSRMSPFSTRNAARERTTVDFGIGPPRRRTSRQEGAAPDAG